MRCSRALLIFFTRSCHNLLASGWLAVEDSRAPRHYSTTHLCVVFSSQHFCCKDSTRSSSCTYELLCYFGHISMQPARTSEGQTLSSFSIIRVSSVWARRKCLCCLQCLVPWILLFCSILHGSHIKVWN